MAYSLDNNVLNYKFVCNYGKMQLWLDTQGWLLESE